jgi:hypothetical protein
MTENPPSKFEAGAQFERLDARVREIMLRADKNFRPRVEPAVERLLEGSPVLRELTKFRPLSDILSNDDLADELGFGPPRRGSPQRCDVFKVSRWGPRPRKLRHTPPDGLKTAAQAAAKLGISVKTLIGYVKTGALKYVALGHGKKRRRKMFTDADLNEFIANQTRKAAPCPSTAIRARHTGNLTSGGEVLAFTALQRRRRNAKPKP